MTFRGFEPLRSSDAEVDPEALNSRVYCIDKGVFLNSDAATMMTMVGK